MIIEYSFLSHKQDLWGLAWEKNDEENKTLIFSEIPASKCQNMLWQVISLGEPENYWIQNYWSGW